MNTDNNKEKKKKNKYIEFIGKLPEFINGQAKFDSKEYSDVIFDLEEFIDRNGKFLYIQGTCVPIGQKPCIDTKGNLYPCEKIMNDNFKIGSLASGYDEKAIKKYLNDYYKFKEKLCGNCWAKLFCSICMSEFIKAQGYGFDRNDGICYLTRKRYESIIKVYTLLLEKNNEEEIKNFIKRNVKELIENGGK